MGGVNPKLNNGKLHFENKESLRSFIENSTKDEFSKKVRAFQSKGFYSLQPIFYRNETDKKMEFLKRKKKRLLSKSSLYTSKNFKDAEIDIEDELIYDPNFAAVLNEDREIYVGDKIYIYTKKGLYFTTIENEKNLYKYLDELEKSFDKSKSKGNYKYPVPCGGNDNLRQIEQDIYLYTNCGGGGEGGGYDPPNENTTSPLDIIRNLSACVIDDESLWQQVFGEAETCHDYFADNRRVKTKFWNQNYYIFSSIGMKVKHQKRNLWIWDASDAVDYIELGITEATFTYNSPVAVYNETFQNIGSDIIFVYNDKTYTAGGDFIQGHPIKVPEWPFNTLSGNNVIDVYIFNRNYQFDAEDGVDLIRDAVRDYIINEISDLETSPNPEIPFEADDVAVNGVVMNPYTNTVTFTMMQGLYRSENDCCITKVLDFNFLLSFDFKLKGGGYYYDSNGVPVYDSGFSVTPTFKSTDYTDLKIDFYGLARRDGDVYRGNRMVTNNIEL